MNAFGYLRLRDDGRSSWARSFSIRDTYRLSYIRGPEGRLIGLAQELN
ncbi:hypothetical protein FHT82_005444 [Rhizobium sp. BK275]|jgi:hypothetical protein|nr:hypothetical protein [Rhizobium sp. BK275]MBB3408897.1 hypothetical protein [Rhizobium sp. BK316]